MSEPRVPIGYIQCRGYPVGHYCIVLIPEHSGRVLCYGCAKSRKIVTGA